MQKEGLINVNIVIYIFRKSRKEFKAIIVFDGPPENPFDIIKTYPEKITDGDWYSYRNLRRTIHKELAIKLPRLKKLYWIVGASDPEFKQVAAVYITSENLDLEILDN